MRGIFITLVGLCVAQAAEAAESTATVERLRCEYRVDPLSVEAAQPRLAWESHDARRGAKQTAYQVLVASSPEKLAAGEGDLWDSGRVASERSIHVAYAGKPLGPRMQCFWKSRVWDKDGQPTSWSQPGCWTMGINWQAAWILASTKLDSNTPLPIFRREFDVSKPVRRAEVSVCGLGFQEVHLNGHKVGDDELAPGWTNYRQSCLYSTYDVTRQLVNGRNALGVMLGNGMYNVAGGRYAKFTGSFGPPMFILQLHIDYADGSSSVLISDESWKATDGPIRFSCIYGGEDYDARKEISGWDRPGLDDSAWKAAKGVLGSGGTIVAASASPIKVMKEFKPIKVTNPKPGVYVYDLGQNHSGFPQLTVHGPAGKTVKMIPGELLEQNGLVRQSQSGTPVWFAYTLKGGGREVWRPRFSYYGYRYVQVEGGVTEGTANAADDLPRILDLTGQFVHCSAETVGSFTCSNPKVNRVHEIIDAAILSNFQSVLTDCPHREKLGWLEQSHLIAGGIMFNYDVPTFYAKICDDMQQAQTADGLIPDIAPEYTVFPGGFRDSPEWGSAYVIDPWRVYLMYGDATLLAKHYEGMKRYVAYLGSKSKDHIVSHGLGDWADYGPNPPGESQLTSRGLTATAVYYQDITILRQTATLLGKQEDADRYGKLADEVRAAFDKAYFHADNNQYDRNSQTANAMPLMLGLVREDRRAAVLENLVKVLRANGNRVTAGDIGFMYLMRALSDGGRGDVLYDMVCQEEGPGYMFQLKKGATTMTETWDCYPNWSQNHCMLGHAEEWFYRGLGGIQPEMAGPGFKRFTIAPQVVGGLASARASYRSLYGMIVSDWKRQGDQLTLKVTVPPNSTATVHVPAKDAAAVTESGKPAALAEGVKSVRLEGRNAVFEVVSGSYRFESKLE
jgi:alpha-L-rhamnosidase